MKRTFTLILWILLFTYLNNQSFGQASQGSTTGLAFLKMGVGSRASGMGEAFTAVANDAAATYWNPAGLAYTNNAQFMFTHNEWIQDVSNEFLAFIFPAFNGVLGMSIYSNNVDGIQRRVKPSEEPLGTVSANDIAFGLSFGYSFMPSFKAGLTVKYLYEKIYIESAKGIAFDLGLIFQPFANPLQIALVVQNVGSMGKLRADKIDLPATVRLGSSYKFELESMGGSILLAADGVKFIGVKSNDGTDIKVNLGAELLLRNLFAFRLGYQSGYAERNFGGGFGLIFKRYHLDYGYTPLTSNLGNGHKFSFILDL